MFSLHPFFFNPPVSRLIFIFHLLLFLLFVKSWLLWPICLFYSTLFFIFICFLPFLFCSFCFLVRFAVRFRFLYCTVIISMYYLTHLTTQDIQIEYVFTPTCIADRVWCMKVIHVALSQRLTSK